MHVLTQAKIDEQSGAEMPARASFSYQSDDISARSQERNPPEAPPLIPQEHKYLER